MIFFSRTLVASLLLTAPFAARAQEATSPPEEPELLPVPAEEDRVQSLENRIADLEDRLARAEQPKIRPRTVLTFAGYADVGFFVPSGSGAGFVQDVGNQHRPDLSGYGWVFLGDILATPVNTRGDPADLGDAPGVVRHDAIHSQGSPGFILNEINLRTNVGLTENALLTASVNFVPRSAREFSIGDYFEVDQAQLEWLPFASGKTSIFVGKFDSVIGIEYKERRASQRFGITPSLIHRYTSGTPIGLKVRSKLLEDQLIVAAALTNGSSTTEQFHFYTETDTNWGKTVSGRIAARIPMPGRMELGLSGEYGPQDHALDSRGALWFWGVDLQYSIARLDLKAQFLKGRAPGDEFSGAYSLVLNPSGYFEANYMVLPMLGLLGRVELRDALVTLGTERAYLTRSWRGTLGVRYAPTDNIVLKAEYLKNGEYAGLPQVANDLFTSSLVLHY